MGGSGGNAGIKYVLRKETNCLWQPTPFSENVVDIDRFHHISAADVAPFLELYLLF